MAQGVEDLLSKCKVLSLKYQYCQKREHYGKLYANKLNNLDEMDKFPRKVGMNRTDSRRSRWYE
jgi:hypothetical protein